MLRGVEHLSKAAVQAGEWAAGEFVEEGARARPSGNRKRKASGPPHSEPKAKRQKKSHAHGTAPPQPMWNSSGWHREPRPAHDLVALLPNGNLIIRIRVQMVEQAVATGAVINYPVFVYPTTGVSVSGFGYQLSKLARRFRVLACHAELYVQQTGSPADMDGRLVIYYEPDPDCVGVANTVTGFNIACSREMAVDAAAYEGTLSYDVPRDLLNRNWFYTNHLSTTDNRLEACGYVNFAHFNSGPNTQYMDSSYELLVELAQFQASETTLSLAMFRELLNPTPPRGPPVPTVDPNEVAEMNQFCDLLGVPHVDAAERTAPNPRRLVVEDECKDDESLPVLVPSRPASGRSTASWFQRR